MIVSFCVDACLLIIIVFQTVGTHFAVIPPVMKSQTRPTPLMGYLFFSPFPPPTKLDETSEKQRSYGGHINSPAPCAFGRGLSEQGFLVVSYDQVGHGHSDGERCFVEDYRHLAEDCLQLVARTTGIAAVDPAYIDRAAATPAAASFAATRAASAPVTAAAGGVAGGEGDVVKNRDEEGDFHLQLPPALQALLPVLPFGICGQSLGGSVCLMVGRALTAAADAEKAAVATMTTRTTATGAAERAASAGAESGIRDRFLGAVLLCPAIQAKPPPRPVVFVLRHLVASWAPRATIPDCLEQLQDPTVHWTRKIDVLRSSVDSWGMPGGLGYGQNMRFGTGVQLLDMTAENEARLPDVNFPFAVLHDPADAVIKFAGTQLLMARAASAQPVAAVGAAAPATAVAATAASAVEAATAPAAAEAAAAASTALAAASTSESTPGTLVSGDATLVRMDGLKHDLLSNANARVRTEVAGWLGTRLEMRRLVVGVGGAGAASSAAAGTASAAAAMAAMTAANAATVTAVEQATAAEAATQPFIVAGVKTERFIDAAAAS
ncbi:unnamed protein product [Phaeothamnion confervicola]